MHSCYHAGDIGDVIYGLYAIAHRRNVHLTLGPTTCLGNLQPRDGITPMSYVLLSPLLQHQPCIERLDWSAQPPFAMQDLNEFRLYWRGSLGLTGYPHLLEMYCARFDVPFEPEKAWLLAGRQREAAVVLARSPRQHNHSFPWAEIVNRYGKDAIFVGLPTEYAVWADEFDPQRIVRYRGVANFWELACLINGADLFVGNSSMPLAIAEGLKKPVIQEVSQQTVEEAHTVIKRRQHVLWRKPGDLLEIRS